MINNDLTSKGLDKDLDRVGYLSDAADAMSRRFFAPGVAVLFLALCAIVAAFHISSSNVSSTFLVVTAAIIGGYMAMNIGANDVANNVGPAVGARVMSLTTAILIAAVCESAGALIAGSNVVSTISGDILSPSDVPDPAMFTKAMLTAMVGAALWINFSTWIGAPVSTTHSIVGGVVGAGIAASSFNAIDWTTVSAIALSWMLSPLIAGMIGAVLIAFVNSKILYASDQIAGARVWLPILLGLLAGVFSAFLMTKGVNRFAVLPVWLVGVAACTAFLLVWHGYRTVVDRQVSGLETDKLPLRALFSIPLICTSALLSFAHGANDVANAIGPLAAIVQNQANGVLNDAIWQAYGLYPEVPVWVSMVGAFGISAGLLLFGRRLIRVVGKQITKLNPIRAFCVTLATAGTVLAASAIGYPVSSTHTAVGAIFGVGLFREWYRSRYSPEDGAMKRRSKRLSREERRHRLLVRRSNLVMIIAAWAITLPASATLSAVLFHFLSYVIGL
nr:inorganic phosphate transporter [Roseibium denhamense]